MATVFTFILSEDNLIRAREDMLNLRRSGIQGELCLQVSAMLIPDGVGFEAREVSCQIVPVRPSIDPISEEMPAV